MEGNNNRDLATDNRLRRAWIQAVGRTSLPKSPRLCLEYFDAYCFEYTGGETSEWDAWNLRL